jgi:hypothetical protein
MSYLPVLACPCQSLSCLSSVLFLLSLSRTCPATLWSVSMRRTCYVISVCPCKSLSCLSSVPLLLSLPLSYLSGHIVVCLNEVSDKGAAPGQSSGTAQLKTHLISHISVQRPNLKKNMVYGTLYAEVDYNITLCPLKSRLHGQPYARVDLNPVPESTLSPSQELWIWPLACI